MPSTRVSFVGSSGQLGGRLHMPVGSPRAFALFAHCFTCGKDLNIASRLADTLCAAGLAVLRFDFTGLGDSEGDFPSSNFSSNVDDLLAAGEFLRSHHQAPQLLVGHSLGGAAVLAAASRIPESRAIVTIAAPAEPSHLARLLAGPGEVDIGGRVFRIQQQFLDDLEKHNNTAALADLDRALLIMHAPFDQVVGIDNASGIFMAARHPKSFISLDGADHLLTRKGDAEYAGHTIAAWASRYLDESPAREASPDTVRVEVGAGGYATQISAMGHALRADEPRSVGGTDSGPTPYALLLAALGACTVITLRMYADRKGWPLEGVRTELKHHKIHAADCDAVEQDTGRIDVMDRQLHFQGPLSDDQRARLIEIADRCPVHRTLEGTVVIRTSHAQAPR